MSIILTISEPDLQSTDCTLFTLIEGDSPVEESGVRFLSLLVWVGKSFLVLGSEDRRKCIFFFAVRKVGVGAFLLEGPRSIRSWLGWGLGAVGKGGMGGRGELRRVWDLMRS